MDKFIKLDNKLYLIKPSKKENKKYDVYIVLNKNPLDKKYIVSFGQKGMEQYKDKFGFYKHLDHNDKKRKDAYRARHKNDNINDPNFAGYWSWNFLWD